MPRAQTVQSDFGAGGWWHEIAPARDQFHFLPSSWTVGAGGSRNRPNRLDALANREFCPAPAESRRTNRCSTRTNGLLPLINGANLLAATKAPGIEFDHKLPRREFMRCDEQLPAFDCTAHLEHEECAPGPPARGPVSLQRVRHGSEACEIVRRQLGPPHGDCRPLMESLQRKGVRGPSSQHSVRSCRPGDPDSVPLHLRLGSSRILHHVSVSISAIEL